MELAVLTFVAVFLVAATGVLLLVNRLDLRARLSNIGLVRTESPEGTIQSILQETAPRSIDKVMDPFQRVLPRSDEEVSITRKRMILAGYRKDAHVNLFYATKVVVPVLVLVLVTVTRAYEYGPFFVYALGGALGFLIPDFWVGHLIDKRQDDIRLALPEALDLMVICVEAGLGLDQALIRVADELILSQPVLAEELLMVNLEQRAGRPRAEAWKNLAARTDVDSVRALVAMLLQADQFGTSIARSLRVHADSMRTQRRQQAEEQAAKTTVKLIFPLVFFIFPSLFVVVLGPSWITITEAFKRSFGGG
jgi:tight adherence protein C